MNNYFIILHDLANLNSQILQFSSNEMQLNDIADKLNHLFAQSGVQSQFLAEVHEEEIKEEISDGDWSNTSGYSASYVKHINEDF